MALLQLLFSLLITLPCTWDLGAGTCTTEETRRLALNKVLASQGCNHYQCALQKTLHPATSCDEILNMIPNAPSGYYWLQSTTGSAVRVYCDMTLTCKGVGGGWMQVKKLDMTNDSHQCPPGTSLRTDLLGYNKSLCGPTFRTAGCSSTIFSVHGIKYSQVCGKIIAYQDSSPDAFGFRASATRETNIDGNYVDGISLTYGNNTRTHIWTFAAALDDVGSYREWKAYCNCTNTSYPSSSSQPPAFVGTDYFCDTGSHQMWSYESYPDDPLWDGAGCGADNTCCSLNDPPWFLKQLSSNTTDDIEMRICRDQSIKSGNIVVEEGTPIEILELYVR